MHSSFPLSLSVGHPAASPSSPTPEILLESSGVLLIGQWTAAPDSGNPQDCACVDSQ